jgi:hypothetical protein
MSWIEIFLVVGLASRIIRLAVYDDAGHYLIRLPLLKIAGAISPKKGHEFIEALTSCPFCVGFWISLGVAGSWAAWGETLGWQVIALAGSASYLGGHLAGTLDEDLG